MGTKFYRILFFTWCMLCAGSLRGVAQGEPGIQGKTMITKDFNVDAFEKIELSVPAQVEIVRADHHSVKVEAPGAVASSLKIFVKENTLCIRLKAGKRKDVYSAGRKQITVYISLPKLTSVVQGGVGDIWLKGNWKTPFLELRLKGVGNVRAEELHCGDLEVFFTGTGSIRLAGEARAAFYKCSGVGDLHASEMKVDALTVRHSGVSEIFCRAVRWLEVKVSGIGNVVYYGEPLYTDFHKGSMGKIRQGKH